MTTETELIEEQEEEQLEETSEEQTEEQPGENTEELTEEEQQYKALCEQLEEELEGKRQQSVKEKKIASLKKAGYDEEQAEYFTKFIVGESDKEIQDGIAGITADFPPKRYYADPTAGNGQKQAAHRKNIGDIGRQMYQGLKKKGKISRKGRL